MPSWRRVFTSPEAFVESKAGACPPEECPVCPHPREMHGPCGCRKLFCGCERAAILFDWPFAEPPPYPADDEGEAEAHE